MALQPRVKAVTRKPKFSPYRNSEASQLFPGNQGQINRGVCSKPD